MSRVEGLTLPQPGVPKTLGILNVIFGVMLVLLGVFSVATMLVLPAVSGFVEKKVQEQKVAVESQEKAETKAFDDRVAAAKTDEEKQVIEQERTTSAANRPRVVTHPDMSGMFDALKDPTIKAINYAGILSGLVLHVALLVAGVGLIRLTSWGRTLSVWWAGLQIVQVLALMSASIFIALPINQPNLDKQIAKAQEMAKAPGAGQTEAFAAQLAEVMGKMAAPMIVGQSLTGMIYPVILLIMLNSAGARAACLATKPDVAEDF